MENQEFARREERRKQIAQKVATLKKLPKPPSLVRGGDSVFLSHSNVYPTFVRQQKIIRQEQELANRSARFVMKQMSSRPPYNTVSNNNNSSSSSSPSSFLNNSSMLVVDQQQQQQVATSSAAMKAQLREKQRQWLIYVHVARFLHIPLQAAQILAMIKLRKLFAPVIRRARMRIKKKRRMAWLLIASQWKMKRPTAQSLKEKCNFFKFWPDDVLKELLDNHMVPASDTFGSVLVMGGSSSSNDHNNSSLVSKTNVSLSSTTRTMGSPNSNNNNNNNKRASSPAKADTNSMMEMSMTMSPTSTIASSATRRRPSSPLRFVNMMNNNNNSNTNATSSSGDTHHQSQQHNYSPLACDVYITDTAGDLAIYSSKQLHPWSAVDEVTQTKLVKGADEGGAGNVLIGDLSVAAQYSSSSAEARNRDIMNNNKKNDDDFFFDDEFNSKNRSSNKNKSKQAGGAGSGSSSAAAFRFSLELRCVGSGMNFFWRIPHAAVYEAFLTKLSHEQRTGACRAVRCDYLELTAPLDHSRLQHSLSQWDDIQWPTEFVNKLRNKLKPEYYPKGTVLYREGEKPPRQFILTVSGAVNMYQMRKMVHGGVQQSQHQYHRNNNDGMKSSPSSHQYTLGYNNNTNQSNNNPASSMMLMMEASGILPQQHNNNHSHLPPSRLSPDQLRSPGSSVTVFPPTTSSNNNEDSNNNNNFGTLVDKIAPWTILDLETTLVCGSRKREHTAVCATDVEAWVCDFSTIRRIFIVEYATFALMTRQSFQRFVASSMNFLSETMGSIMSVNNNSNNNNNTSSSAAAAAAAIQQQHQLLQQQPFFRGASDTTTVHLARALKQTTLFQFFPLDFLIDLCNGNLKHPITGSNFSNNNNNNQSSLPRPIPHCTLPGDSLLQNFASSVMANNNNNNNSGASSNNKKQTEVSGSNNNNNISSNQNTNLPSFGVIIKGTVVLRVVKETEQTVTPYTAPPSSAKSSSSRQTRQGSITGSSMFLPTTTSSGNFDYSSSQDASGGNGNSNDQHQQHSSTSNQKSSSSSLSKPALSRRNMVDALRDEITSERDPTVFLPHYVSSPSLIGCNSAMVSTSSALTRGVTQTTKKATSISTALSNGGLNNNSHSNKETGDNSSSSNNNNNNNNRSSVSIGKTTVSASDEGCVYWWEVPVEMVQRGLVIIAMMNIMNAQYYHNTTSMVSMNSTAATATATTKNSATVVVASPASAPPTTSSSLPAATTSRGRNSSTGGAALVGISASSKNTNNKNNSTTTPAGGPNSIFNLADVAATYSHNKATVNHGRFQAIQRALLANIATINASANDLAANYWDQLVKYCREQTNAKGSRYGGMLV